MDDDLDSGLQNIAISDSEDSSSSSKPRQAQTRAERTAQSEADFQAVKAAYKPRIENGEIHKAVRLPLGPAVPKPEAQQVLHAVEELYFFRRYGEAAAFVRAVFGGGEGTGEDGGAGLDADTRKLLRVYERKCLEKMDAGAKR